MLPSKKFRPSGSRAPRSLSPGAPQKPKTDNHQQNGKRPLQHLWLHVVGQTHTKFGEVHTGQGDPDQGRPIDKTGTPGRQVRMPPTRPGIGQGAGDRNWQATGRGGSHHLLDSYVTPGQKGNRQSAATDSEQRRGPANATSHQRSEEHTSELQSRPHLVCRLLLEKKKNQ